MSVMRAEFYGGGTLLIELFFVESFIVFLPRLYFVYRSPILRNSPLCQYTVYDLFCYKISFLISALWRCLTVTVRKL